VRRGFNVKSIVIGLIIINVVIFLFTEILNVPAPQRLINSLASKGSTTLALAFKQYGLFVTIFSLFPILIRQLGWVWQVFTYMFLHGSFFHIFFNMYALMLFGRPLEQQWGKREFFFYYIFTGVGAGIVTFFWNLIGNPFIPTIGASGAVFGLVLAFGLEFPDAVLLLFFLVPVRAKYAVFIFGGIELAMIATGSMRGIGHFTHLAGLLFGYVYYLWRIKSKYARKQVSPLGKIQDFIAKRSNTPSVRKKERVTQQAENIKVKLDSGFPLTQVEEKFLEKLREAYNRYGKEICDSEEFDGSAADCLNCEAIHACLYRYVLDIQ
jgi:membrane associated rhomboid family serine protease